MTGIRVSKGHKPFRLQTPSSLPWGDESAWRAECAADAQEYGLPEGWTAEREGSCPACGKDSPDGLECIRCERGAL